MKSYIIETDRLLLSKWQKEDLDLASALWGSPEVTRYICAHGYFTASEVEQRLQTEIQNDVAYGVQYWPVFERASGSFIGCCGLRPFGRETDAYEFGVHLLPAFHRKGYASEGGNAVIAYAFDTLGANVVYAGHHPDNDASRHMLGRLGFVYLFDSFYEPTGLPHPAYKHKLSRR